ncbi:MAG: hypothetical protein OXG10_02800 [Candidatus Dadabacteria bacterium]|nr:hypothetical protein [Candidatus Dadabacteria bacterium]
MKEKPAPSLRLVKNGKRKKQSGDAAEQALYLCAKGHDELDRGA